MSGKAFGWAKEQRCPTRGAKDVLKTLGDYADENGFAYPSVGRLAAECDTSERTIQRDLRALEEAGLLRGYDVLDGRTGRSRTRVYWFPMNGPEPTPAMMKAIETERSGRVTPVSPIRGDASVTGEGDTSVTGRVTTVSPLYEPLLEPEGTDVPSPSARADEDQAFEALVGAYPPSGIDSADIPAARLAFAVEVGQVGDPWRIVEAARSFAADPKTKARTFAVGSLNAWLTKRSYLGRLPAVVTASDAAKGSAGTRTRFACARFRAVVLAAKGEDWVASWLDRCGWDANARTIHPRTSLCATTLRTEIGDLLKSEGVKLEGRG